VEKQSLTQFDEKQKMVDKNIEDYIDKSRFIKLALTEPKMRHLIENELEKGGNLCPEPVRSHDVDIAYINESLERYFKVYNLDLNPDFQRGHIWSQEQQIKYIESLVKGFVGLAARTITFNNPSFGRDKDKHSDLDQMLCIDGLQRLNAIMGFVNKKFTIFEKELGGVDLNYFNKSSFSLQTQTIKFQIMNMQTKLEVLNYYINFNSGGTPHTENEINRVKSMRDELLHK
jgi:hypothetical protein